MRSTVIEVAIRLAISASLAVSGVIHAYLYVHGYRDIPTIGPGFLGQAIVFCVLALLILAGRPDWLRWVAGVLSAGAMVAFGLSRITFETDGAVPSDLVGPAFADFMAAERTRWGEVVKSADIKVE